MFWLNNVQKKANAFFFNIFVYYLYTIIVFNNILNWNIMTIFNSVFTFMFV